MGASGSSAYASCRGPDPTHARLQGMPVRDPFHASPRSFFPRYRPPEPEREPEPEPEPVATVEALRSELEGLRLSAVQKRAVSEGVPPDAVEDAVDGDDPKASLIRLIVESASRRGADRQAELEPEPEPAAEGGRP